MQHWADVGAHDCQHGLLTLPALAKVQQVPRTLTCLRRRCLSLPLEGRARLVPSQSLPAHPTALWESPCAIRNGARVMQEMTSKEAQDHSLAPGSPPAHQTTASHVRVSAERSIKGFRAAERLVNSSSVCLQRV